MAEQGSQHSHGCMDRDHSFWETRNYVQNVLAFEVVSRARAALCSGAEARVGNSR